LKGRLVRILGCSTKQAQLTHASLITGKFCSKNNLVLGGYQIRFYKYTGYCQDARRRELHGFFMKTVKESQTGCAEMTS
jgi:hypothetical protein